MSVTDIGDSVEYLDDMTGDIPELAESATSDKFKDSSDYLLKNFIMLHGSNMVWDLAKSRFMKIEHLKLSASTAFPIWKASESRMIADIDSVVFDPTGKQKGIINMFSGFKMQPKEGDVEPILNHLMELCGDDNIAADWVLKWIAYQLQNPGSKMMTAVVMHGKEGTGKNIFWNIVVEIFGKYGIQIGQSQIEADFNGWLSCKLFILANEVVSNRERKHIKGRIKALITEDTAMINEKGMPLREERLFANFAFLSNEFQPIDTDPTDRRYMVIEANRIHNSAYFTKLKSEINPEAFYHYLLNLDLGDFNQHTKPFVTDAKKALLKLNSRTENRFIDDWMADELDYPFQNVTAIDLYWAYRCWCVENGEKYPTSNTTFGRAMATYEQFKKERASYIGTTKKVQVYFVDCPETQPPSVVNEFMFSPFREVLTSQMEKYKLKA